MRRLPRRAWIVLYHADIVPTPYRHLGLDRSARNTDVEAYKAGRQTGAEQDREREKERRKDENKGSGGLVAARDNNAAQASGKPCLDNTHTQKKLNTHQIRNDTRAVVMRKTKPN